MPDESPKTSSLAVVSYGLVAVGVVLVGLGLAWKSIVPGEAFWSAADAEEWMAATEEIHAARSTPHNHSHHAEAAGDDDEQFRAAKQRLATAEQKLGRARAFQQYTGHVLAVVGAVLAGGGALLLRRHSA